MARITVEDCLEHVENRFQLVLLAAKHARQLARGNGPARSAAEEKHKPAVAALRDFAAGNFNFVEAIAASPETID